MLSPLLLAVLLQTPPVPPGWTSVNNQTPLEASGPSQAVRIPVAVWDPETSPVAPDVSFSYSITASDKDTFSRVTNPNTNPPTTETQLFPSGVNLFPLEIQYVVEGGTSSYTNGIHTWVYAGHGVLVPPKPKTGEHEPIIIGAKTYINRHRADDNMPQVSVQHDNSYTVNVTLTRAAYTLWKPKPTTAPPGGSGGG